MGNSDNSPDTDTLSLGSSAPLWSRITDRGDRRARRSSTSGSRRASRPRRVDAFTGYKPGPVHDEDDQRALHPRHRADPDRRLPPDASTSTPRAASSGRTAASGRRRRSARSTSAHVEASHPSWQRADNNWTEAGGPRRGRRRRREGHPHLVLLRHGLLPVRADVGRDLRPDARSARWRRRRRLRRATTSSGCSARRRTAGRPRPPDSPGPAKTPEALGRSGTGAGAGSGRLRA